MDAVLDNAAEGVVVVDADWRVTAANAVATEFFERETAALVGTDVRDSFPRSAAATFHEHFGGDDAEPAETDFEEYFPELETWLDVRTVPTGGGLAVYLRDVTDRRGLERELDGRKRELTQLTRNNAIIQRLIRDLVGLAETRPEVEADRVVHEATDATGGVVEVKLTGDSPALVLAERGAAIRTATFDHGTGRIVAEIGVGEDVREIVEAMSAAFPDTELLSKRERNRSVETAQEFRSALHERLTDRQRNALRTAFFGGYFESPRDSTAEELATTLGISSPTLHYHLRAGQRKLVDAFFDEETDAVPPGDHDLRAGREE